MNYYNDIDPGVCAWLEMLIEHGMIAPGKVDHRSICDVTRDDLAGFVQCHFFCGIGGWPRALDIAGWPRNKPVWTGSCPCQPFSTAGKREGQNDERHLWPELMRLIRECRPECVFGEQVESAIGIGWLDGISADLEAEGYACGAAVLGAHSVASPHRRQRLYWVGSQEWKPVSFAADCLGGDDDEPGSECSVCGLDYTDCECPGPTQDGYEHIEINGRMFARKLAQSDVAGLEGFAWNEPDGDSTGREHMGADRPVAAPGSRADSVADSARGQREQFNGSQGDGIQRLADDSATGSSVAKSDLSECERTGERTGFLIKPSDWDNYRIIPCRDEKSRRVESQREHEPMANGIPALVDALRAAGFSEKEIEIAQIAGPLASPIRGRTLLLKGYGNAIVPQVAAEFVSAYWASHG